MATCAGSLTKGDRMVYKRITYTRRFCTLTPFTGASQRPPFGGRVYKAVFCLEALCYS